jgi:hypothetical protein
MNHQGITGQQKTNLAIGTIANVKTISMQGFTHNVRETDNI